MTREEWLNKAVQKLAPRFVPYGKLPEKLHIITSFPNRKSKHGILGVCYPSTYSKDKGIYITISPGQGTGDEVEVLATIVHEMIHAVNFTKGEKGHGKCFKKIAEPLGLEGKMTATVAGKKLEEELKEVAKALGPYPHIQMLNPKKDNPNPKKNGGTIVFISPEIEGYRIYIAPKWLDEFGPPLCPVSKKPMEAL